MPIKRNENLRRKIYNLLLSRGYDPVPKDSDIKNINKTVEPEEGDVIKFTFNNGNGEDDNCYIGLDGNNLTVYYDEDVMKNKVGSDSSEMDDSFFGFLKFLRQWSYSNGVKHFKLDNKDNLTSDMAQRTYMKKKEQIAEGYYSMGKQASYSDAVPTVKIILQHTRQIQEGEQRYRNVAKIFLENTQGERILAPTLRPGIAQVYARHLAEGGVPNDERWNHMKSLCEEYSKMAGFVRATKNHQFNESAQELVNTGVDHYIKLRETLGKLRGHKGYNTYFESWTPTLMEDEGDYNTINELFVQETMDPRIESVLPILNKLRKNVSEMKEVDELAEWADNLTEAPGAMTLKHNQNTEKSNLKAFDLEEDDDAVKAGQTARDKIDKPAVWRKAAGEKPVTLGDVERSQQYRSSQAMVGQKGQEVEESGLQAYLGNKNRDGASKEKMASIRAKYDKLDEEGMEEGWNDRLDDPDRYEEYLERLRDLADYNRKRDIEDPLKHKAPTDNTKKQADESLDDMHSLSAILKPIDRIDKVGGQDMSFDEKMKANTIMHLLQQNPSLNQKELEGKSATELIRMSREGVAEGDIDEGVADNLKKAAAAGILGLGLAAGGTQAVKDYNTSQDVRQTQQQAPTAKIGSKNYKVFSQDLASKGEYFARKVGSALKDKIIVTDGSGNQFYLGVSSNNGHNYRLLPTSQTKVNTPTATVGNKQMTVISPTDYEKGFGQKAVLDKMLVKDNSGNSYYLQVTSNTGHNMWLVPVKNVKEGVAEGSNEIDQQAHAIADKLTTGKNLEKLRGMAYDSTVYRALDRYFEKHNIPETIYNRVAKIVFQRINQQGVAEGSEMNLSDFKAKLSSVLSPRDNTGFKIYPSGTGHRGFALVSIDNKNKGFPMNNEGVAAAADFIRIVKQQYRDEFDNFERTASQQGVAEGSLNEVTQGVEHSEWADNVKDHYHPTPVRIIKKRSEDGRHIGSHAMVADKKVGQYNMKTGVGTFTAHKKQSVAEGEFAGHYQTGPEGQWRNKGPKANKPAKVGDLVGASESFINTDPQSVVTEMDKSQPSSDRGGESSGDPYAKGGKATPVKAKDAENDAKKALEKSMDKAHKKDVKEGQEDLDAILRIIRK